MPAPDASAERREQILGEVAEGLHLVFKETQRRAMEAEDNDEFVRLAGTLHKLARGVRQCLGWHAKLERERRADAARAAEVEDEAHAAEVQDRRAVVARKVARRFQETWPDDDDLDENEVFNQRLEALDERLDDLSEDEDFLDRDPDALITQLCEEFGVEPPSLKPLTPGPLIPAKAGEAETQVEPGASAAIAPTPRANGHDRPHTDSS